MSVGLTHFKLGLLTLVAVTAGIAVAFALGARATRHETIRYDTYFDESVEGLTIGSPVKYRGVAIGSVIDIEIAPDNKSVDVGLSLEAADAERLGLVTVPLELRAQLGTQGITGVKFVDMDFFDPKTTPPPTLGFAPAQRYIPAAPSLMKGLAEGVGTMLERLPAVADGTVALLQKVGRVLDDLQGERIPNRLATAIDDIDVTVKELRTLLQHADRARIPDKIASAVDGLSAAIGKVSAMVDGLGGDGGLVASTQHATDSVGELGRRTMGSADELRRTLRDLDEAARAIRSLARDLERDPDMLLKGRTSRSEP